MSSALLDSPSTAEVDLQELVAKLFDEVAQLRREVSELRCDVGYWKSRHADAVKRNQALQQELDEARAEIKTLKADLWTFPAPRRPHARFFPEWSPAGFFAPMILEK